MQYTPICGSTCNHRGDIDDAVLFLRVALGARDHALGRLLGHEERAAQVGVHHERVILGRDVDQALRGGDTGIVDEDIDGARFRFRMRDGRLDAGEVGYIERHHVRGAAIGFDFGAQFLQAFGAARRQHDLRARLGQHFRKARAEAARCAGNQGNLALEIDFYAHELLLFCFR